MIDTMKSRKPRRAVGTQTSIDVIKGWFFPRTSEGDIEALANGQERLIRCYLQPEPDEQRKQWKPGYLTATGDGLHWVGTSNRWPSLDFTLGEWAVAVRSRSREDHVYSSFGILVCTRLNEKLEIAVPRRDLPLCIFALTGAT
jgi:hypothetical protein